jgi:DNA-binding CsgD family transcriptional regulator
MDSQCKTGKKCFQTNGEAVQFEIQNRQKFGDPPQYTYLCEDCGFHHLSHLPPGEPRRAKVDYDEAAKYAVRTRRTPDEQLELRDRIMELTDQGKTSQQIADELKVSVTTVYNLRSARLTGALAKTVEGIEIRQKTIQEQIAELQAQLQAEERKKKEIIEAKQLKVQWSEIPSGRGTERILVITQNEERFPLVPEEAMKLAELLRERLDEAA